ncbi:hypothetical protein C8R44DRAFT_861687 [Mycena epipterygia]|nr:hypothetical protein C8R44DRAFT_861687 [Mycena epipterygia]
MASIRAFHCTYTGSTQAHSRKLIRENSEQVFCIFKTSSASDGKSIQGPVRRNVSVKSDGSGFVATLEKSFSFQLSYNVAVTIVFPKGRLGRLSRSRLWHFRIFAEDLVSFDSYMLQKTGDVTEDKVIDPPTNIIAGQEFDIRIKYSQELLENLWRIPNGN